MLMWTPPTMWNRPTNRLKHEKLEQVSNCNSQPIFFEIVEIKVEESVDLGSRIKYTLLLNTVL